MIFSLLCARSCFLSICILFYFFLFEPILRDPSNHIINPSKISTFDLDKVLVFQVVPLTAAVIVTTPQKLAFIDVAKGVRMFSKLKVCVFSTHKLNYKLACQ